MRESKVRMAATFFWMASTFFQSMGRAGSGKLGFERTDYRLRQRHAHLLAHLFSEFMSGGILDVQRAHLTIMR